MQINWESRSDDFKRTAMISLYFSFAWNSVSTDSILVTITWITVNRSSVKSRALLFPGAGATGTGDGWTGDGCLLPWSPRVTARREEAVPEPL